MLDDANRGIGNICAVYDTFGTYSGTYKCAFWKGIMDAAGYDTSALAGVDKCPFSEGIK